VATAPATGPPGPRATTARPRFRRAFRDGGGGPLGSSDVHGRFGLLLLVLIASYLLSAFTLSKVAEDIEILLFLAALLLAVRAGNHPSRVMPVSWPGRQNYGGSGSCRSGHQPPGRRPARAATIGMD
jgi:hypothetical protein